ncbi:AIPR family protein [Vibrio parahaemolyticus]|nr:AIPR family protein [Vibrio parahaemolyticus]ELB2274859.1 AIPR family protein [Vibrio parahaemolyticus]HCG9700440.1 AIPR family protein [Vibrio parahaemolyticus]HCM0518032.1 AIPR family protein [Vibrio parahaemolyticus]
MKHSEFYKVLDSEFESIIKTFSEELNSKLKQDHQKKSFAFMVWFLNFYSGIANVEGMITDGGGDHSCDIILDRKNSQGDTVFYLIQSKWNQEKNCNSHFESEVLKAFLSDANSVLRGDKEETENTLFNKRYKDLLEHVKCNGEVKVIYLTLKNSCKSQLENIKSFESSFGGRVKVDAFDINRLKMDYIDINYKRNNPPNPLEKVYSPEFESINISIIKDRENHSIKIDTPFPGIVFNVKPSTIYNLVERYGVSLFNKNVRNPLNNSNINNEIVTTLKSEPAFFWYYNNGITAITRKIPSISSQAESFDITGLQVINGAQTAYSIHKAFSECSEEERALIDEEARITFRLLKSGGDNFDLKVTKYTNSQNPVSDRDFCSSDPLQKAIQKYFYNTSYWYECRRGEFRDIPDGTTKIENSLVANAYLAFYLSDPVSVFEALIKKEHQGVDLIFTSHKENKDGLYEKIFNKDTNPEEVYAAFCMLDVLLRGAPFEADSLMFSNAFHILACSKIVLQKYLSSKYEKSVNITNYIVDKFNNDDIDILAKMIVFSLRKMKENIEENSEGDEEKSNEILGQLMLKKSHFELFLDSIEKLEINHVDIDSISIDEDDEELELATAENNIH